MSVRRAVPILAAVLALGARDAQAFFDPPWITPVAPRAGDVVSVNMRMGICDARVEHPGYPQITRQGNAIRLLVYGHHWDTQDLCIYPIGQEAESIGVFPPGDYALTVDFTYDDYPFGLAVITLGVVAFTVAGASPPAPVPAATPLSTFVLLVTISSVAAWAFRMRLRSNCCASRSS
jgi:hypothetical protein